MVLKEILRARAIPRDALLEKIDNQEKENKITFNITSIQNRENQENLSYSIKHPHA